MSTFSPRKMNRIIPAASAKEMRVRGLRSDLPSENPERSTSACAGGSSFIIASSALDSSLVRSLIITLLRCSSLDLGCCEHLGLVPGPETLEPQLQGHAWLETQQAACLVYVRIGDRRVGCRQRLGLDDR